MKQLIVSFLLAACAFASVARAAEDKPFFPLGLWYEGGVGDARDNVLPKNPAQAAAVYEKNFADIAAHGINVIAVPNSPPDHHELVLDTAQKHGLKVILELGLDGGPFGYMIRGQSPMDDSAIRRELDNVLAPIKDHPALLRVQLLDEPPGDAFDRYGKIAAAVRAFDPNVKPFCCLTGGSDGGAFLAAAKSDVVAFDMYPIGPSAKVGDPKPLNDFASYSKRFADWATKHDAAAWAVVQCHEITGQLRYPTPAEVRAMTWSALAHGNRGIFWFLYQSEHVVANVLMAGLVDREFKPTPLWDEVGKLAKELARLTPTLSQMTGAIEVKQDDPLLLLTRLSDAKGIDHFFAVNLDTNHERTVTIPYVSPPQKAGKFNIIRLPDGQPNGVLEMHNGPAGTVSAGWGCNLPPGGAAVFRLEPAAP